MIKIEKSPNADSRTATEKVSKDVLLSDSHQHIGDVLKALCWMAGMLLDAAAKHDWTKVQYIDEFYHDYKQAQDGFQGDFKEQYWYKVLHLQERHHLSDYCPEDVTLFDVLERIADGAMAGMARSGIVYEDSLSPEILTKAYHNTMKLLESQVIVGR